MPVQVRIAAEIEPWTMTEGAIAWLEHLFSMEKSPGYQGQGISAIEFIPSFAKALGTKVPSGEAFDEQMAKLESLGYVSKVGPRRVVSTPKGHAALNLLGQRGSLWVVLESLLKSGKLSKTDVIEAMVAGYKKGSEDEMVNVIKPPTGA